MNIIKPLLICPNCGKQWYYSGIAKKYAGCPKCKFVVKLINEGDK